jgi:putative tryptophan/tyrosine transport system substrate-binding protein
VAVLWNATYSSKAIEFRETQQGARSLNITLQSVELRSPRDFDGAFVAIAREKPDALITLSDGPLALRHQREIVAFTTKHRLPMVSETTEFAEAGGLMTYGASLTALFRRAPAPRSHRRRRALRLHHRMAEAGDLDPPMGRGGPRLPAHPIAPRELKE